MSFAFADAKTLTSAAHNSTTRQYYRMHSVGGASVGSSHAPEAIYVSVRSVLLSV